VAELTVTIVAPAIGGARGRDPAGVRAAGAHRGEAPAARHEPRGPPPAGRGPVAELAFAVEAPAIGAARGRDPAAVDAAGAHRGEAHAARHEHRARPVSRGSVAELAPGVVAPAIGGARGRAPAGVAAGAHRGQADDAGHAPLAGPPLRSPVAELTGTTVAPT